MLSERAPVRVVVVGNSGDEEMVVSDAPDDERAPGHGRTRRTVNG